MSFANNCFYWNTKTAVYDAIGK